MTSVDTKKRARGYLWMLYAVLLFALCVPAFGHGPASQESGRSVDGEVLTVGERSFDMKTPTGKVTVLTTDATQFVHWDRPGSEDELTRGMHVSIFGATSWSGQLTASKVLLGVVYVSEPDAPEQREVPQPAAPSGEPDGGNSRAVQSRDLPEVLPEASEPRKQAQGAEEHHH